MKRFRAIIILTAVTFLILQPASSVFAANLDSTSYDLNASDRMPAGEWNIENTAKIKVAYEALSYCLFHSSGGDSQSWNQIGNAHNVRDKKFMSSGAQISNAWIENEGEKGDGVMHCSNNNEGPRIIDFYLSATGYSYQYLICGNNADGKGTGVLERTNNAWDRGFNCGRMDLDASGNDYNYRGNGIWQSFLRNITIDALRENNAPDPTNTGLTASEQYIKVKKAFESACSSKPDYIRKLIYVEQTNAAVGQYESNVQNKKIAGFYHGPGNHDKWSCEDIASHYLQGFTAWASNTHNYRWQVIRRYNRIMAEGQGTTQGIRPQLETKISSIVANYQDEAGNYDVANFSDTDAANYNKFSGIISNKLYIEWVDSATTTDRGVRAISIEGVTAPPASIDDNTNSNQAGSPPICSANSGALGWILCPVLTLVANAGEFLWSKIEEQLSIDAESLLGNDSGTQVAWETFRNIADIILVILFLVIIISQLTGIGISNYGIKKALPKVIVAAILINLSLIICQLAVDLSNILGASLGDLLANIVPYAGPGGMSPGPGMVFAWIGGTLAAGGVLYFFSPQTFGAILGGIVLLVITAFLAVLVLFVALAIRQMGIVILVVLAPLAFACMVLPNTNKLFEKWLDLFKALLIVYPVCAILVGGATMASTILLNVSGNNEIMNLLAVIIPSISFFFVPTLVKTSINGIGQIGAKLGTMGSRIGNRVGGSAQNRVKNAETWKNMQNKSDARRPAFTRAGRQRRVDALTAVRRSETADMTNRRILNTAKGGMQPSDFASVTDGMSYAEIQDGYKSLLNKVDADGRPTARTQKESALMAHYATKLKPDELQSGFETSINPLNNAESRMMATALKNNGEAWGSIKAETPDLRNTIDSVLWDKSGNATLSNVERAGDGFALTENGTLKNLGGLSAPGGAGRYSVSNLAEMKVANEFNPDAPSVTKIGNDLMTKLSSVNARDDSSEKLMTELMQFNSELSTAVTDAKLTPKWSGADREAAREMMKQIEQTFDSYASKPMAPQTGARASNMGEEGRIDLRNDNQ